MKRHVGRNPSNVAFAESEHMNDHPHTRVGENTCGLGFPQNEL